MRTKTKELLMQKLPRQSTSISQQSADAGEQQQQPEISPTRLPRRHPTLVSHLNEHNLICILNHRHEKE